MIRAQADISLLDTIWADEGVDANDINLIHLLNGGSDLTLVGLEINDKGEGVVLLDLLHGGLSAEWVLEDGILIELVAAWECLALELRVALKAESLRAEEVNRGTCLNLTLLLDTLLEGLGSSLSLHDGWLLGSSLWGSLLGGNWRGG